MENIFYLIIGAILGATFTGLMFWFDVGYGRAATPVINMEADLYVNIKGVYLQKKIPTNKIMEE
jgi:hypothetical protein